jgi:hypothetical protein
VQKTIEITWFLKYFINVVGFAQKTQNPLCF